MTIAYFTRKVKDYLAEDNARAALKFMAASLREDASEQDTIILQLARVNRLQRGIDEGTINKDNAETDSNRINAAIKSLANNIEAEDLREDVFIEEEPDPISPPPMVQLSQAERSGIETAIELHTKVINALRKKLALEDDPIRQIRYEEQLAEKEAELKVLKAKLD